MKKSLTLMLSGILMILLTVTASSANPSSAVHEYINFTPQQVSAMGDIVSEHGAQMKTLTRNLEATFDELIDEILKDDAPDTPRKLKKNPKKINALVKKIGTTAGDIMKMKVEYILKAKNILTPEQKKKLIAELEYKVDYFDKESPFLLEIDTLAGLLDLSSDQMKKILKYRTDMSISELKLRLSIANEVIDIQDELARSDKQSATIDKKIMTIVDQGARLLNNKIDYIIKAKDVLNPTQKQELAQLVLLNIQALMLME